MGEPRVAPRVGPVEEDDLVPLVEDDVTRDSRDPRVAPREAPPEFPDLLETPVLPEGKGERPFFQDFLEAPGRLALREGRGEGMLSNLNFKSHVFLLDGLAGACER